MKNIVLLKNSFDKKSNNISVAYKLVVNAKGQS